MKRIVFILTLLSVLVIGCEKNPINPIPQENTTEEDPTAWKFSVSDWKLMAVTSINEKVYIAGYREKENHERFAIAEINEKGLNWVYVRKITQDDIEIPYSLDEPICLISTETAIYAATCFGITALTLNGKLQWEHIWGEISSGMDIELDENGNIFTLNNSSINKFDVNGNMLASTKTGDLDSRQMWIIEGRPLIFGFHSEFGEYPGFALQTKELDHWLVEGLSQKFTDAEASTDGKLAYLIDKKTGNIQSRNITVEGTEKNWENTFSPFHRIMSTSKDTDGNLYLINQVKVSKPRYRLVKITTDGNLATFEIDLFTTSMGLPQLPHQVRDGVIYVTADDKVFCFDANSGQKLK
jgi:hypothetical protein